MRFTLSKLFMAVTLAALACVALILLTHLWVSLIFSLTILLFAYSALTAVRLQGREKVFAVTFAAVGFAYLIVVNSTLGHTISAALITNYPLAMYTVFQQKGPVPAVQSPIGSLAPPVYASPSPNTPIPAPGYVYTTTTLPNGTQTTTAIPYNANSFLSALDSVIPFARSNLSSEAGRIFLIGHCAWSWLIALCAAWFAGRMYGRRPLDSANR